MLKNRTAVITGGANGLGLATAVAFAREGANVVIGDLDAEQAAKAAAGLGIGARAVGIGCNVTSADDVDALAQAARASFGGLDVWVNNAGFTRDATMRKMSEDDFDAVISVHLKGAWLGTRAAAGVMRDQPGGGSIINVSSISGKVGNPGQTNYSSAKAGIVGLTKAAAKEVGFANVRVNAVQPGIIRTALIDSMKPEVLEARLAEVPLARFGEPEEVASVILFLASDLSSYVTGTVLEIAGGRNI
ncbi:3-oxoacyl-ACP reductase FabG [Pseudarthrobacter sulfonivorans]|jgi:3-oxoacyl-[acyl-carrier protein] reductase|uniref:3-oxoacyl-ACP reductase FabG n=1 Tax=Pseudarthrobacter sulfonivorans TaxID=121292 RepID=UPI00278A4E70|nr:3-oxoacyl-ACP reductase FabG [Pseudarthrobacter sulfonivorans]MDQ0000603.1 3-oxoacyl-[acyl-carrier protein] reductase [Pseudarthrobacter sulfonivorans]